MGIKDMMQPIVEPVLSYRSISCLFSFMSFLLLLVAFGSHSWRSYRLPKGTYSLGLWRICMENSGCQTLKYDNASLETARTFMLVAVLASFMATIWVIEWDNLVRCNIPSLPKALMASICNFLAGISVLIALAVFESESRKIPDKRMSFRNWAFYLNSGISVLCLVTGTLDLVAYKFSLWESRLLQCKEFPNVELATLSDDVTSGHIGIDVSTLLITLILSTIELLLLVIAHVSGEWATYNVARHPVSLGIWTTCSEDECNFLKVREVNLDFVRSLMVIATLSCIVAVLCLGQWDDFFNCTTDFLPKSLIAAICNIITGISVLIALVIFDITMVQSKPRKSKLPKQWAFYLSCATCILSFLTGIYGLIICKLSLWKAKKSNSATEAAPE